MPRYLTRPGSTAYACSGGSDMCDAYCAAKSLEFFDTLSEKLVLMTQSLNDQFEDIRKQIYTQGQGAVLASVVAQPPPIGVKYEYIEYIKEFGPPLDGIFDQQKLITLRIRLGLI